MSARLQVLDAKIVVDKPARGSLKAQRVAECTVGDETGTILFTARNEQGGWLGCRLCWPTLPAMQLGLVACTFVTKSRCRETRCCLLCYGC